MFIQTAKSGTWAPKAGQAGVYTLTLTGAPAQTINFSDRPQRIVGVQSTADFLDVLGFSPKNPPNAALVAQTSIGEDVLVIELFNPVYTNDAEGTLTYDARVLENYAGTGLAFLAQQQNDDKMEATFTDASLFIDSGSGGACGYSLSLCVSDNDCCSGYVCVSCDITPNDTSRTNIIGYTQGMCLTGIR